MVQLLFGSHRPSGPSMVGRKASTVGHKVTVGYKISSREKVDDFSSLPFPRVLLLASLAAAAAVVGHFTAILRAFNFSTLNKQAIKLSSNGCLSSDLLVSLPCRYPCRSRMQLSKFASCEPRFGVGPARIKPYMLPLST